MDHEYMIWVIGGPAGSGKTTVAEYLKETYSAPYVEGDELHSQTNIKKMSEGIALTDEDRIPWLGKIGPEAYAALKKDNAKIAFVTCSSLRKKYRDLIRQSVRELRDRNGVSIGVRFLFITASEDTLTARIKLRKYHYMKESMVISQVQTMELPTLSEQVDTVIINATGKSKEEVEALSLAAVKSNK
ncbi:P-loop containing nucleoside triphosphate hydrolase protein [Limtongia smithiae]|uniref:P-loop containing nucleoside triphosphate hydrolase protein n=1 Tax=Limtongia smithiae TaxID=1125753 RepID=UPI0034CFA936